MSLDIEQIFLKPAVETERDVKAFDTGVWRGHCVSRQVSARRPRLTTKGQSATRASSRTAVTRYRGSWTQRMPCSYLGCDAGATVV